ncbi:MAG: hypothetical protein V2B15_16085 [Bacteroidota bacterium]
MKIRTIFFICIISACLCMRAQNSTARIENVRSEMTGKSLVIKYDIVNSSPGTYHQIELMVIDNKGKAIYPDSVSGDTGPLIPGGTDKIIVWELYKEYDVVYGNFTPRLIIDAGNHRKNTRGPEYATLSLLLPGLGDYFVAESKQMKFKPYYKTALTAGFLGLSLASYLNREVIPPVMNPPGWYYTMQSPDPVYIDHEWVWRIERTDYWLFQYDAEVLLGIGIASWLFDVIWVARQGVVNNRMFHSIKDHVALVPGCNGLMLGYNFQF